MSIQAVLFVNLRRAPHEGRAALMAAHRQGYDVVLLADKVPDYASAFVAEVEVVDTYNFDQALQSARALAERFQIAGVVTWSDRDVELVSRIAESLGLPGPNPIAARRARNKFEMKQALAQVPDLIPRHARVRTWNGLQIAVDEIGLPAVIKPTGASGSKGIFELRHLEDLPKAFAHLQQIAQPSSDPIFRHYGAEFILEEFLSGPEFSVEGWVYHGEVLVAGITDKWTTDPFHLEYQHIFPSRFPESETQKIVQKTTQVVETLELDNCTFHLEAKLTERGFRLIEIAARVGGDYITSHLIPLSTGIDFYAQVIRVATGMRPLVEQLQHFHTGVRFLLAEKEGNFMGLAGTEDLLNLSSLEHLFLEVASHTPILLPPRNFVSQRAAAMIVRHPDYAAVIDILEGAKKLCAVLT